MICDILHTINKYEMIKKGETVAVGVSGGADSVCLLHFLSLIREDYGIVVKVVHVNHNIRGEEAKRDENFVKALCESLGVEFICFNVDVPKKAKELSIGEEECARKLRYECFEKVECDKIATAHTLSDSAETVIFNLARGTGLKGVCGISPKRGKIIRPLIELTRADTEKYCRDNALLFVTDSTNLCDDYTRNKIRHNVIPILKEINGGFEKNIGRFTETAINENNFIDLCALELVKKATFEGGYKREVLLSAHTAVLKRAVAILLSSKMQKDTEYRHIELCCNIIKNGKGSLEIGKDLFFEVSNDIIRFRSAETEQSNLSWEIKAGIGKTTTLFGSYEIFLYNSDEIREKKIYNCIAADNIDTEKLILRSRRSGDEFTSIKRKNTKTLKKIFIENKVAKKDRHKKALLCFGNEILWVESLGTNAKYVVQKETKKILLIKQMTE